jgi:g-D-glutamyl-meso-diaminopimelate peptidase
MEEPRLFQDKKLYLTITLITLLLALLACSREEEKPQKIIEKQRNNDKIKVNHRDKENIKNQQKLADPIIVKTPNYTYTMLKKQLIKLEQNYNNYLQLSSIGKSVQGRKLYLLKVGTGKEKIGVIGGVHGREGITSLLTLKLAEDYIRVMIRGAKINNYNLTEILKKTSFYFIPMLNPDGVEIAINGIKKLDNKEFYLVANQNSSDFKRWKANAHGVDLNKQFKANWQELKAEKRPHFAHYKGPSPESEPESKALADLTRQEEFDAVVAFHSSGDVIYWYYNQAEESYQRDYQLAKALSAKNGYRIVKAKESDKVAAGYKDWFIKKFHRPGFTIEIGSEINEKPLPSYELAKYFQENREVLLELALLINTN